jgi:hypothetical protein
MGRYQWVLHWSLGIEEHVSFGFDDLGIVVTILIGSLVVSFFADIN